MVGARAAIWQTFARPCARGIIPWLVHGEAG